MDVIRKYKKNDWWDFLIVINQEIDRDPTCQVYLDLLDELFWRRIECISEGGLYKLRQPAKIVLDALLSKREGDKMFCTEHFLSNCYDVYENIIK